ncbi:MAG: toll/interleukin-1 receptor domain-containing protein [Marinoscillum sp.]
MKAIISYSHADEAVLDRLHKHLAQIKRDGLLDSWTDQEISAGGVIDDEVNNALSEAELFIAIISADYIASNYCYEIEFQEALKQQERGAVIIVPVIARPCDWHSTPFKKFRALPKDGKAITDWANTDTALLDVTQNLRNILNKRGSHRHDPVSSTPDFNTSQRNYKVKRDFDSIEKLEYQEQTFSEIKKLLESYMGEIAGLENIKAKVLDTTPSSFKGLIVNRNRINNECALTISTDNDDNHNNQMFRFSDGECIWVDLENPMESSYKKCFRLGFDEYDMFWNMEGGRYHFHQEESQVLKSAKELADIIWNDWLNQVGLSIHG